MAKSKCTIALEGFDEIISQIEKMGKDIPKVITKAVENSAEIANEEYKKVIEQHKYSGLTEETLVTNLKASHVGNKIILHTGFDIKAGGLAAIFLDRGTPVQKPVKFVAKIKRSKKVKSAFEETLERELG